jgi:hypothetical protein
MLLLIDSDRTSASRPSSQPIPHGTSHWSGRRAALHYAVGLLLIVLSKALAPVPGYIVILGVCVFLGLGLGALVRDASGLKGYRQ